MSASAVTGRALFPGGTARIEPGEISDRALCSGVSSAGQPIQISVKLTGPQGGHPAKATVKVAVDWTFQLGGNMLINPFRNAPPESQLPKLEFCGPPFTLPQALIDSLFPALEEALRAAGVEPTGFELPKK